MKKKSETIKIVSPQVEEWKKSRVIGSLVEFFSVPIGVGILLGPVHDLITGDHSFRSYLINGGGGVMAVGIAGFCIWAGYQIQRGPTGDNNLK